MDLGSGCDGDREEGAPSRGALTVVGSSQVEAERSWIKQIELPSVNNLQAASRVLISLAGRWRGVVIKEGLSRILVAP